MGTPRHPPAPIIADLATGEGKRHDEQETAENELTKSFHDALRVKTDDSIS
jgi:hypothetical protein